MCKFKFCQGKEQCFLRNSSPCPEYSICMEEAAARTRITRRFGFRYNGFLERDRLMEALDGRPDEAKIPGEVTGGEKAA